MLDGASVSTRLPELGELELQLVNMVHEAPHLRAWETLLPLILEARVGLSIVGSAVGRSLRFGITLLTTLAPPATHCRFLLAPPANPLRHVWTWDEGLLD